MTPEKKTTLSIIAAIVILILIVVIAALSRTPFGGENSARLPAAPAPVYSDQGKFAVGFPKELAPTGTLPSASYSIAYGTSTHQYTAEWSTSSTPDSIIKRYELFFLSSGWQTSVPSGAETSTRAITASNASGTASLFAQVMGKTTKVIMTYMPAE